MQYFFYTYSIVIVNTLFKELFVFTDSGICLYSWKSALISESTDSTLISGLLFAVSEFTKTAFRGRLQRLDLDNSKLIMTAQEFSIVRHDKENGIQNVTLIFGALVDNKDNNHLIQELLRNIGDEIISHYDLSGMRPMEKSKIDPLINTLLKNKTYSRNKSYILLGTFIAALGIFLGSVAISINWQYFIPTPLQNTFELVPVMLFSFGIVFIGAMIIGEKNNAIEIIVSANGLFSLILFFFFDYFTKNMRYFSNLGSFDTYIVFVLLISFTSSLFGSLLTEKKFLFPENY